MFDGRSPAPGNEWNRSLNDDRLGNSPCALVNLLVGASIVYDSWSNLRWDWWIAKLLVGQWSDLDAHLAIIINVRSARVGFPMIIKYDWSLLACYSFAGYAWCDQATLAALDPDFVVFFSSTNVRSGPKHYWEDSSYRCHSFTLLRCGSPNEKTCCLPGPPELHIVFEWNWFTGRLRKSAPRVGCVAIGLAPIDVWTLLILPGPRVQQLFSAIARWLKNP